MTATLVLLLALATIGSIDGTYYHTLKFRLYDQPSARFETITHVIRAFSLAAALAILSGYVPAGGWYWGLLAVFAVDLVDDLVDISIEPASRAPMGGLPPREYLVHMIVMALSGGAWVTFAIAGWPLHDAPTALLPHAVPSWLVWCARIVAVGAVLMGIGDAAMLTRSVVRARRETRTA